MSDHATEINTARCIRFTVSLSESENKSMTSQPIRTYSMFKLNVKCSLQPITFTLCDVRHLSCDAFTTETGYLTRKKWAGLDFIHQF